MTSERILTLDPLDGFFWLDAGLKPAHLLIVYDPRRVWTVVDRYLARMTPASRDEPDLAVHVKDQIAMEPITDVVRIGGDAPIAFVSSPISDYQSCALAPPGDYDIAFSDVTGHAFRAIVLPHSPANLDLLLERATPGKEDLEDDWWIRNTHDFEQAAQAVLRAAEHSTLPPGTMASLVVADVPLDAAPAQVAARWRDIDSAWIYDRVNPIGDVHNAYRLDYSPSVWGQDTLTITLEYLPAEVDDQVQFRVSYLRTKRTAERNWDELITSTLLRVHMSAASAPSRTRCVITQDSCPEALAAPLRDLWTLVVARLER